MNTKRQEFLKGLATLFETDVANVVPDAALDKLGPWDSLSIMSLVVLIDEVYAKVVHGAALAKCVTVEDVLKVAEA